MKCWGVEEQKQNEGPLSRDSVKLSHTVGTVDSQEEKRHAQAELRGSRVCGGFAAPDLAVGINGCPASLQEILSTFSSQGLPRKEESVTAPASRF